MNERQIAHVKRVAKVDAEEGIYSDEDLVERWPEYLRDVDLNEAKKVYADEWDLHSPEASGRDWS